MFAIGDEEQRRSAEHLGDQYIQVRGDAGAGLLLCHASRPLDMPHHDVERLIVVVHGALRNSDIYLGHAAAAAAHTRATTLIVAPQFLADVDVGGRAGIPDGALYWDVEGWKGGESALGPVALSSFTAMDSLLRQLTGPQSLPPGRELAAIIVGNSAGASSSIATPQSVVRRTAWRSAASGCVSSSRIRRPISISIMSGRWRRQLLLASTAGATDSRRRPPMSMPVRGRAWSVILRATSRSCSAPGTTTAQRCCSR